MAWRDTQAEWSADAVVHDLHELDAFETMAEILRPDYPRHILDVGAHAGSSAERLLGLFPGAQVTAFEPVGATFDRLSSRFRDEPRLDAIRSAVGARDGETDIHVNGLSDTSSVLAPTKACERYHGDKVMAQRLERVPIVTLDAWAAGAARQDVGAIKIDVQGLELDVLRGAETMLRSTVRVVISEAQMAPIYVGASTFSEIDLFLRGCGFVLHQVCRIASGGAERRVTCCDAMWVRADVHASYVERCSRDAAMSIGAAS